MCSSQPARCHGAWWRTPLHADRLLSPLPIVTNVNNSKLTDFAAILLPKIAGNEIYTYYGTIWEIYTNKKSKYLLHVCLMLSCVG